MRIHPRAFSFVAAIDQSPDESAGGKYSYLLIDEVLIISFDTESPFHFLDLNSLFKELSVHGQHLSPCHFTLFHHSHELTSIF